MQADAASREAEDTHSFCAVVFRFRTQCLLVSLGLQQYDCVFLLITDSTIWEYSVASDKSCSSLPDSVSMFLYMVDCETQSRRLEIFEIRILCFRVKAGVRGPMDTFILSF